MSVLDSLLDAPRLQEGFGGTAFNPDEHPRDWRGKWRSIVGALKVGERAELPSGARVIREGKLTHTVKAPNGLQHSTSNVETAAHIAANAHESILKRRAELRGGSSRSRGGGRTAHGIQPIVRAFHDQPRSRMSIALR